MFIFGLLHECGSPCCYLSFIALCCWSSLLSHGGLRENAPQRPRCSAGQLHKGCRCWCVAPRWIMVVLCLCSELQWAGGLGLDLVDVFFASLPNGRGKLFVRVCSRGLAPAEHGSCLRGLATQWEGAGTSSKEEQYSLGHPSCPALGGIRPTTATPRTQALR